MNEAEKELIKQAEGVITEVYKDTLRPSLQPIGSMLSYLPRTIRLAFSRWEKWIINGEESLLLTGELLRKKLENIPEEKICEPEPFVAIPAIQQLSYCENSDELRNLYANLLASSMNTDTKWQVHPAFVDIIKQLNPDEAKLLKAMPAIIMVIHPLINVKLVNRHQKGENDLISNFTNFGLDKIDNKGNICSYIENLERLKLIEIPPLTSITDKSKYEEIKENPILKNSINEELVKHFDIRYELKSFHMTNFGVAFSTTCCK